MSLNISENVLSQELLHKLLMFTREGRSPSKVNFFNWTPDLNMSSNAIFLFFIEDDLKQTLLEELLAKKIFSKVPKVWGASVYLMSRMSYVTWHNDSNHKFSCTIYINQDWNENHGGYFMYELNDEIRAIKPNFNSCVYFDTPLKHTTTLTALNAPFRESIQIFVDEWEE